YKWEDKPRDALCVTVFDDERPLRGVAGLVDWRLCGRLSRLLVSKKASGGVGESMMLPASRRLPMSRIFWFGLGPSKGYSEERMRRDLAWMGDVLTKASVGECAMQLPGRSLGLIGARRAIELVLDEPMLRAMNLTIVDDTAGNKDIADVLRQAR
ncbi:MAG TPA: M17 family peptidase N-terminal domain-containing protein, partial [Kofleriaceae bacterium]|nr:M17 family peptidase N-terminal domain-containing protein [Kofleriaceae bacterium]